VASSFEQQYDLIVVGNEPAGLWLMRRWLMAAKSAHLLTPRLLWIRLGKCEPVAIPTPIARAFGIEGSSPWSAQIVTPQRTLSWDPATIQELFPHLPRDLKNRFSKGDWAPRSQEKASLHYTLRAQPELLTWATGLWRAVGRAENVSAETAVWAALLAHSFVWWNAEEALSTKKIEKITIDPSKKPGETPLQLSFPRGGPPIVAEIFQLGQQLRKVSAKKWLWNSTWRQMQWLTTADEQATAATSFPVSRFVEFPFEVLADTEGVRSGTSPLTLYFDTEEIPEERSEIWPIFLYDEDSKKKLQVQVSCNYSLSLETVAEQSREALKRLRTLFPMLLRHERSVFPPLAVETCLCEESRMKTLQSLEWSSRETFRYSRIDTRTKVKNLFALSPSYRCFLPYPLGPLQGAKEMLREWIGRKNRIWVEKNAQVELS
jgi:hypothetical protein